MLDFYRAIFPKSCIHCDSAVFSKSNTDDAQSTWADFVCRRCLRDFLILEGSYDHRESSRQCITCGELSRERLPQCTACSQFSIIYPWYARLRLFSLWPYRGAAKTVVKSFKFDKRLDLASPITALLSREIRKIEKCEGLAFNQIVAVPSSKRALRKRGFSHTSLLAQKLSKSNNLHYLANLLCDKSMRTSQTQVADIERYQNVANQFQARKPPLPLSRILLIDDVITSGATVFEAARVLHNLGAQSISILTLARSEAFSTIRLRVLESERRSQLT